MQHPEEPMTSYSTALPELPGMLVRAIPTVVRTGKLEPQIEQITAAYTIPALTKCELEAYQQRFPKLVSEVPLTYFYLIAQRAHLAVMLNKEFPWPILGMVHVANKMEQLAPISLQSPFELEVRIDFPARAATRKRVRPLYTVDFIQQGTCVVRCESTYQVGAGGKPPASKRSRQEQLDLNNWEQLDIWRLDSGLGRSYAKLSGDYNPIHLHPWLSRWFGFSQPIIHGMYSVARMQADLEHANQQPVRMIDVTFRRPLTLPNTAVSHQHGHAFMLTDAEGAKAYLDGQFRLSLLDS